MIRKLALVAGFVAALAALPSAAEERGDWPDLPAETKAVVLATGADFGYYQPRGCNGLLGGSLYRINFDRWLAAHAPGVQRIWISTGDNGPGETPDTMMDLAEIYAYMGRVGFVASGIGATELRLLGGARLAELAAKTPFPLLSANLQVHETGATLFPASRLIELAGARVLFVAATTDHLDQIWGSLQFGTILLSPVTPAVRAEIDKWRGRVDRIVLLSSVSKFYLPPVLHALPGIDLVISAPADHLDSAPEIVEGIPVLWLLADGRALGRIALGANGAILEARIVFIRDDFPIDPRTGEATDFGAAGPAPPVHDQE